MIIKRWALCVHIISCNMMVKSCLFQTWLSAMEKTVVMSMLTVQTQLEATIASASQDSLEMDFSAPVWTCLHFGRQRRQQVALVPCRWFWLKNVDDLLSDVSECLAGHRCSADVECTNTEGSYTCHCRNGFNGDGYQCTGLFVSCLKCTNNFYVANQWS